MSHEFGSSVSPYYESLLAEQKEIQADKCQVRFLEEYNAYIFPGSHREKPLADAVTNFLKPLCLTEGRSLQDLLAGMYVAHGGVPVHWADMGGGRGLAMRQLASDPINHGEITMTNVDLFDYGLDGLQQNEFEHLETVATGMTDESKAPQLLQADVETVTLPEPADLITSVESIQYLNNPLAAISNWYNQLADYGILVVVRESNWSNSISYEKKPGVNYSDETPTKHLLELLTDAGIAHAITDELYSAREADPCYFRSLVIQKRPGTQIEVTTPVTSVRLGPWGFKGVSYEEPPRSAPPIIEVTTT